MKIIFSPSKGMSCVEIKKLKKTKEILFPEKTENLLKILKKFSKEEISKIMKIKGDLLEKTFENYRQFENLLYHKGIELYSGVSYRNLDLESYRETELDYMKNNLRILSAFYGVITPETLIKEYRLDMTMKIGDFSLYTYWRDSLEIVFKKEETILNLASGEFSKMLDRKHYHIIDIEFRQIQGENIKNISTEAKKMRGKFLDFMIKNRIEDLEKLKSFNLLGYSYSKDMSQDRKIFFVKN